MCFFANIWNIIDSRSLTVEKKNVLVFSREPLTLLNRNRFAESKKYSFNSERSLIVYWQTGPSKGLDNLTIIIDFLNIMFKGR